MKRYWHYEMAFEDYLRQRGIPYVPVNETRKVIFSGSKIKSFDFLVYPSENCHWIVDVKGRKFPYAAGMDRPRYWENWVSQEDLDGLAEWQGVFGTDFEARFVFAYLLEGPPDHWPAGRPHCFRDGYYAFLTASLDDYRRHARRRSAGWNTVNVPRQRFREMAKPVAAFCAGAF